MIYEKARANYMRKAIPFLVMLIMLLSAVLTNAEEIPMITSSNGKIYGELNVPSPDTPIPLIILSHGFGGNLLGDKDYASYFFSQGFATYNFDFCGGGFGSRSDGTMLDMSVLTEAEDLSAIVDYYKADARFSAIYLWGASQGGFVSALVASQRPDDIAKVVLEFPAIVLQDDAKARANDDGTFPETSRVMGMTISRKYNEDAVSFDLYDMIGAYTGPVLILHGDKDAIVPLRYSERAAQIFPNAELVVMPGQGHGFMGKARTEAMERESTFYLK
jgi:pimeloyl-ACP methyl ester carboxylesterase